MRPVLYPARFQRVDPQGLPTSELADPVEEACILPHRLVMLLGVIMLPVELIKDYYQKIDDSNVDWVIDLFADDAVYQRANAIYNGKDEITQFYREQRKIRGKHTLYDYIDQEETVIARGVFDGQGEQGDPRAVEFCDVWSLNHNRVVARQTYLALGADYVRE